MEKPVATDAAGVRRVLAAAEEAKKKNLKVGVGLQRHHQAGYIETIKRLHDGAIGDIVSMRCYWNGQPPVAEEARRPREAVRPQAHRNGIPDAQLVLLHLDLRRSHRRAAHPQPRRHQLGEERPPGEGPRHGRPRDQQRRPGRRRNLRSLRRASSNTRTARSRYSECRHQPGCWNSVSEHVVGHQGHVRRQRLHRSPATNRGATRPKARRTRTSRSTTISSTRSATTRNTTKPTTARRAR